MLLWQPVYFYQSEVEFEIACIIMVHIVHNSVSTDTLYYISYLFASELLCDGVE